MEQDRNSKDWVSEDNWGENELSAAQHSTAQHNAELDGELIGFWAGGLLLGEDFGGLSMHKRDERAWDGGRAKITKRIWREKGGQVIQLREQFIHIDAAQSTELVRERERHTHRASN